MTVGVNFFRAVALALSGKWHAATASRAYIETALTLTGASGGGSWALGSGAPSWLTINASTGVPSGTPPAALGFVSGQTIHGAKPGTTYSNPALTVYNASGGGTWALGAGAPAWLTINSSTGVFGGSVP